MGEIRPFRFRRQAAPPFPSHCMPQQRLRAKVLVTPIHTFSLYHLLVSGSLPFMAPGVARIWRYSSLLILLNAVRRLTFMVMVRRRVTTLLLTTSLRASPG